MSIVTDEPLVIADVSSRPLDVGAIVDRIRRDDCGALVVFEGTVRSPNHGHEVLALEYEAWEERVVPQLRTITAEVCARHGLLAAVVVHRIGRVEVGRPAVVAAAVGVHREAAFRGTEELIGRVKDEGWIWKKELRSTGEVWVEGCG